MLSNMIFYFSTPRRPVTKSEIFALWKSLTLDEKEQYTKIFHP